MAPGRRLRAALVGLRFDPAYRALLAPAYLKAYADSRPAVRARWDVALLQRRTGDSLKALADELLPGRPDLVGLSAYVWNVDAVVRLARELKSRRPSLTVVVGGPEAGPQAPAFLRECPDADLVCVGEGEAAFADLLERLADGRGAAGTAGFVRRAPGGAASEPERPLIADLSTIPSPVLAGLVPAEDGDSLVLETTRGCPFRCKFCDWQNGQAPRHFPLERVLAEARWLLERLSHFFVFYADADPFLDPARGTALARGLDEASRGRTCRFNFQTYLPRVPEEALRLMNSERFSLAAGVESVNERALKTMSRFFDGPRVSEAVGRMRREAPRARLQMQLIYGLPDDDVGGFRNSLSWALAQEPDTLFIPHALALPGAEFGKRPADFGLEREAAAPHRVLSTGSWDAEDLSQASALALKVSALKSDRTVSGVLTRLAAATRGDPLEIWEAAAAALDREAPAFGLSAAIARAGALERAFDSFPWRSASGLGERLEVLSALEAFVRRTVKHAGVPEAWEPLERLLRAQRARVLSERAMGGAAFRRLLDTHVGARAGPGPLAWVGWEDVKVEADLVPGADLAHLFSPAIYLETGGCGRAGARHWHLEDVASGAGSWAGEDRRGAVLSRVACALERPALVSLASVLRGQTAPTGRLLVFDDGLGVDGSCPQAPAELGAPLSEAGWSPRPLQVDLEGVGTWLWVCKP